MPRPSKNSITDEYSGPESIFDWRFSRYDHPALLNFIGGSFALAKNSLEFDRIAVLLRRRRAMFIEPEIFWPRCFIDEQIAIEDPEAWEDAFNPERYEDLLSKYLQMMQFEPSYIEKVIIHEIVLSWWVWCTCPYSNFPEVESSQGWYIIPPFKDIDKFLDRYSWHVSVKSLDDEKSRFSIGNHLTAPFCDQFAAFYNNDDEAGAKGFTSVSHLVTKFRKEQIGSSPIPCVAEDAFMITLDGIEHGKALFDNLPMSESLMFPGVVGIQRMEDPTIHVHMDSMSLADVYESRTARDFHPLIQNIIQSFKP